MLAQGPFLFLEGVENAESGARQFMVQYSQTSIHSKVFTTSVHKVEQTAEYNLFWHKRIQETSILDCEIDLGT